MSQSGHAAWTGDQPAEDWRLGIRCLEMTVTGLYGVERYDREPVGRDQGRLVVRRERHRAPNGVRHPLTSENIGLCPLSTQSGHLLRSRSSLDPQVVRPLHRNQVVRKTSFL